jgi:hypothetical protein
MMFPRLVLLACLGSTAPVASAGQTPPVDASAPVTSADRVRVFLDCQDCFQDYLRDEIDWVDFVRQAADADVHLLSRTSETGGGGREVVLRFVGRSRFEGHDHDLRAITQASDTENVRREVILRTAIAGLIDYVAHDGIPPGVNLTVETTGQMAPAVRQTDRWNLWVFSVQAQGGLNLEETNRRRNWELDFNADRVTRAWKISVGAERGRRAERFNVGSDDEFEAVRRNSNVQGFVAKSLGRHWSFGLDGSATTSSFGNTRLALRSAPAFEFSVFPYEEYATRQFRIQYDIGIERAKYNEVTVYGRLEETHGRHELSAVFDQRQPWGSLRVNAEVSQYLHDRRLYRLEGGGNLSWRIARGLSLDFRMSASRVRDQISLPGRGATPEEVLLRLRQLRSGYEINASYGLRYTFGSLFNNVVNPRFGTN